MAMVIDGDDDGDHDGHGCDDDDDDANERVLVVVVVVSEKLTSERAHELKSERAAGDGASHSSTRLYNVQYGWDLLWNISVQGCAKIGETAPANPTCNYFSFS